MRNSFLKVVSLVAILLLIVAFGTAVSAYEYPDVGYWANEAIDAAIDNGLLRGKDDGKIHSEDNLTRAEMAAIMVRSFGAAIEADISRYSDLKPSAWYYKDFAKAVQMKVFEGDGSGKMRPDDFITREEVFTVVARALVLNTTDYSALNKFNDEAAISSWAKGYMSILTQKAYVNGDDMGNVNPKKNVTRAEFAQLMHNIFRNYYSKASTYKEKTNSHSVMINVGDVTFKNVTIDGDLVIGDGNAQGTIRLENVNIKGRLLVRGSQRVELVKTTVGEMVVVNNYNTVVHFDNYRDEKVFDNIVLNTQATFKKRVGGGGGSSSNATYYTVTFYKKDSEIRSVSVKNGGTLKESQFPSGNINYEGYVKNSAVSSVYSEEYTHIVDYGWWYNNEDTGKWEEFTTATVVTGDMDVYLKSPKFTAKITLADGKAFDLYTFYDPETRFADSVKDIIYKRGLLTALKTSGYYDKIREKGIVQKVLDTDDNIMMLSYMVRFSQILGEENIEKFIVDNATEMFASGNNEMLHDAFVEYLMAVANSSDEDDKKKVHDLMEETINHVFEEETVSDDTLALIRDLCTDALNDPSTFEEVTGIDYDSLSKDTRTFVVDYIIDELCNNDKLFAEVVKEVTGVVYTDTTTTKDLIIAMAEKQLDESFDSTIDDIKDSQKALIVETVESMLSDSSNGLYDEVLTYAVDNEKDTIISTIKTLLETEDSLYDEVVAIVADDISYRAMVADAVGTELATNDALFEVLTGYNPAIVPDRAAAINTLKDEITNNKSSFETAITDAENAGYKTFIIESVVSKLETNGTFFNTVLAEAKVDYKDTMVDTMVDKLEEPNSPMYDKVIELAKTASYKQTITDAIIDTMNGANGNDMISAITGCTSSELAKDPQDKNGYIMNKAKDLLNDDAYFSDLLDNVTGKENYVLPATPKDFIIDMVVAELMDTESTSSTRDMIIEEAIAYLLAGQDQEDIEHLADYAIEYLAKHPEQRDEMVDTIINDVYKEQVDKLVYQLINEEQFDVTANTVFVAEGLKTVLLKDYNYETFFGSKIPEKLEKLFKIYPEEKIIELYNFAMDDLIAQIDVAIDEALAGETGKIDCGITPVINIISDVYVPLYENLMGIFENKVEPKLEDIYYYSENIYLQELMTLLDPEVWVYGSANEKPNDKTGYKIYDLDYYYDLMYKIIVLSDDAILWYHENLSEEKYIEVTNNYQELVLKYANIFADIASDYAEDGTVPGVHDKVDDKLTALEKALREKYPEFVEGMLDAFKNSDFYNKELGEADYQKIRDKVYGMFENINLTTDEYFDKVLNHEAMEDIEDKAEDILDGKLDDEYYSKIDNDTYEFEVNDYVITFIRELIG